MKLKFLLLTVVLLFSTGSAYSQTVYHTPSGKKYYLASCRMVKNVSHATTISGAAKRGLSACGMCRPPSISTLGFRTVSKKTQGTNAKNRCRGITKKGTRCKHYTGIGNDFCYQHLR